MCSLNPEISRIIFAVLDATPAPSASDQERKLNIGVERNYVAVSTPQSLHVSTDQWLHNGQQKSLRASSHTAVTGGR